MKAIVYERYGSPDVLELKEVDKPVPKDNEVLVKIHAASVNAADWHLLRADPFLVRLAMGFFKPRNKILGADIAGTVEAIGKDVKQFKIGDEVFGDISGCGFGGFAEYICAREDVLAFKPTNLTFEEAAAVPLAAVTALQALKNKGKITSGQNILINGASGGVGTFAAQIAKSFGAHVTAVCSAANVDMVRELGADEVIDYTKEDFTKNGKQYDLILAANGYHPISDYKRALSAKGIYVMTGGSNKQLFEAMVKGSFTSARGGKTMGNMLARPNQQDLMFIKELIEKSKIKPVIDRRYKLSEVPDAIRYIEAGHAKGKVVVLIGDK